MNESTPKNMSAHLRARMANSNGASALLAKKTYSVPEAATVLGVGTGLAYEAVRMGTIPSVRLGRRILIPCEALDGFLEAVAGA